MSSEQVPLGLETGDLHVTTPRIFGRARAGRPATRQAVSQCEAISHDLEPGEVGLVKCAASADAYCI
jgi:hypothetical protein